MLRTLLLAAAIAISSLALPGCAGNSREPTGTTVFKGIGGRPAPDPITKMLNLDGSKKINPDPAKHASKRPLAELPVVIGQVTFSENSPNFEYDPDQLRNTVKKAIRAALPQYRPFVVLPDGSPHALLTVTADVKTMTAWGDWQSGKVTADYKRVSTKQQRLLERDGLDISLDLAFQRVYDRGTFATGVVEARIVAEHGTLASKFTSDFGASAISDESFRMPKLDTSRVPTLIQTAVGGAIVNALDQLDQRAWSITPNASGQHPLTFNSEGAVDTVHATN